MHKPTLVQVFAAAAYAGVAATSQACSRVLIRSGWSPVNPVLCYTVLANILGIAGTTEA
jgi:hypothetical protein